MNKLLPTSFITNKNKITLLTIIFTFCLNSCSTIESGWDSITSAGTYVYDSAVGLWEDEEPEESEAVVIEEVYEIPDFDVPNTESNFTNQFNNPNEFNMQNSQVLQFYDPVYRSARQYYSVSPNGSPLPAPPPPPFPQYSIEPNDGYYGFSPSQKFGL